MSKVIHQKCKRRVGAEEYKKMKNKWIRLAVVGTGVPFILGILVTIFNETFNLLDLFGNRRNYSLYCFH